MEDKLDVLLSMRLEDRIVTVQRQGSELSEMITLLKEDKESLTSLEKNRIKALELKGGLLMRKKEGQ